jgi:hypothetical protein
MKILPLIRRKQLPFPTIWGWGLLFILFFSGFFTFVLTIHAFLAPVKLVQCDILVVEGWVPEYALEEAAREFNTKRYRVCVVTGGPLEIGHYLTGYGSLADVGAATLKRLGADSSKIVAVPSRFVWKDRTYEEGVALRKWLEQQEPAAKAITLYSAGCHARRSQLLYEKALGKGFRVGIIACPSRNYDRRRWWHYSDGVQAVADETLAYVYALMFFAFGS